MLHGARAETEGCLAHGLGVLHSRTISIEYEISLQLMIRVRDYIDHHCLYCLYDAAAVEPTVMHSKL